MSEWREVTLGDVITLQRGFDLTEKDAAPGSFPVISSGGASYTTNVPKVEGPGVVTGRKGVLGKVHYSSSPFWPHDTTLWVKDFKGSVPRFVFYLLQTLPLAMLDAGASNPTLNRNHAHLLPVRVPTPPLQARIASVLGAIDDLIENNRRRVEVLEEMARAVYREWFVRFRYPGHEHVPLVDSPLGPIPEGWACRRLADVTTLVRGRSYRKSELVEEGGLPFVNLKCMMRGGGFRRDGLKRYNGKFSDSQLVSHGDLVLAVTDLTQGREILARATLVPRLAEPAVISLDVARIVPLVASERLWIFAAIRWSDFPDRVKEYANGSTVLHLSPDHVAAGLMLWPPDDLRTAFVGALASMLGSVDELLDAADQLALIRGLLLPKLVTGQIDVSHLDLDALTEAASA